MKQTDHQVVVVGGGIGGLGTALALANSGLQVQVLERAAEFSEVGAGIQIGPNAVRVLDRLGVMDDICSTAVFPERGVISSAVTGERLTTLDLQAPLVARFGYPYIVVHRSDVLSPLLDACRAHANVTLENDWTVDEVIDEGPAMRVVATDGRAITARLVVGADGINSRVRRLIIIDEPVFSGHVAFRGVAPMNSAPAPDAHEVRLWIGPGLHLMQYPVRRGELYNQVAVFHSTWREQGRSDWGTPDELRERFEATCEAVRSVVPAQAQAQAYPNYDKEPLDTFVSGRAVLIGDAAHPMLQYLGQGACQALEDGLALAGVLGGQIDDVSALAAYDAMRVPRATRCQRIARPWGASWHTADPGFVAYRDRYFRMRRPDDYSELAWLYDDALEQLLGPTRTTLEAAR
ncbi:FAD-dependent monooxygenase [Microbacterium insulae]|uniref:FAD-dependent monooxygenase n=1 Tax=Microbacterium insulae TaxID=483014 RepID=A0ABW3AGY0_9MICO